jgi:hypothetical protein
MYRLWPCVSLSLWSSYVLFEGSSHVLGIYMNMESMHLERSTYKCEVIVKRLGSLTQPISMWRREIRCHPRQHRTQSDSPHFGLHYISYEKIWHLKNQMHGPTQSDNAWVRFRCISPLVVRESVNKICGVSSEPPVRDRMFGTSFARE